MKLKYFIRGLGTGMIFVALILLVATKTTKSPELTEEEIITRAGELGMVMKDELILPDPENINSPDVTKDTNNNTEQTDLNEPSEQEDQSAKDEIEQSQARTGVTPEVNNKSGADTINTNNVNNDNLIDTKLTDTNDEKRIDSDTSSEVKSSEKIKTEPKKKIYTLEIKAGMYSHKVSERLLALGLIDSVRKFDNYMIRYGYQYDLEVGTYKIQEGSSYDQIAKKITKRK